MPRKPHDKSAKRVESLKHRGECRSVTVAQVGGWSGP
jgi:hypothetical protein